MCNSAQFNEAQQHYADIYTFLGIYNVANKLCDRSFILFYLFYKEMYYNEYVTIADENVYNEMLVKESNNNNNSGAM